MDNFESGHKPIERRNPDIEVFNGIEIQGDESFVGRTKEALSLLMQLESFQTIKQYLGRVKQAERSGMRAYDDVPTLEVADPTSTHSAIWYAGAIAHDTFHSALYHQAKEKEGKEPNPDEWTGEAAERKCLELQLDVLKGLLAEQHIITYVERLNDKPTYQGDNKNWDDYRKRSW